MRNRLRLKREVVPAVPRIVFYVGLSLAITLLGLAVAAVRGWGW
jgi:hypothetical protein